MPYYQPRSLGSFAEVQEELRKISELLNRGDDILRIQQKYNAPDKPRDGDIRYADGTGWDPLGLGDGLYRYNGTGWLRINDSGYLLALKTADQTVNNSTTLVDDTELQFNMLANTKYSFRSVIFFDTLAAADFKWRHTGPAAPDLVRIAHHDEAPSAGAFSNIVVDTAYSGSDIAVTGAGTDGGLVVIDGIIHNGANAGAFKIQWAQNTATVGDTKVLAGSRIAFTHL